MLTLDVLKLILLFLSILTISFIFINLICPYFPSTIVKNLDCNLNYYFEINFNINSFSEGVLLCVTYAITKRKILLSVACVR